MNNAIAKRLRPAIFGLFIYGILIAVASLLGKPLQPFIPVGIALLVIALNALRQDRSRCRACSSAASPPRS